MFLDVLSGVVNEPDDVMVIERVEREPPGATNPHKARRAKQPELVRHCRLTQPDELCEVADAPFTMCEGVHEPNAGWVPEELEHVGNGIDG